MALSSATASAQPLKVCHVFAATEGGRWVFEQLQALRDDHGCHVSVVLGGNSGPAVDLFVAAGIRVKSWDFGLKGWGLALLPWRVLRFAAWLRRERFDVVQSHLIQSTLFARPAAWLADVPVRLEMVPGPFYMQARATRALEAATARMETGIIPSCELTATLYRDAGVPERLIQRVLYYGPRADRFDPGSTVPAGLHAELGLAEATPLIGSVAMFYPRYPDSELIPPEARGRHVKGHGDLIAALPLVRREFPDAHLVLVGTGYAPHGERGVDEVRALVREAGLDAHVTFTGFRSDIAAIYCDLAVSVQASLNDNLGGTVESLLMERPTVATRVGGLVDSVVDGETGILVAPGDPVDLARGIVAMLRDPERAKQFGIAGRAHMLAGFTLETTARALAALYATQRRAAPRAFRPWVTLARIFPAALVYMPLLLKVLLWDYFARYRLPQIALGWRATRVDRRHDGAVVAHDRSGAG